MIFTRVNRPFQVFRIFIVTTTEKLSMTVYRATFAIASHMVNIAIDYATIMTRLAYELIFYESRICYLVRHTTSVTIVNPVSVGT
jgi:hypothetical protein